ncbi:1-acylglycerone phosphate reductase [Pseudohyphozyma bogoriensis]|nr:1-acylglycerone phosphate reductase [Pseudohyphozyma bogoriensis]
MHKPVVLVTGSSNGGIGAAICEAFAANNCIVYASARNVASMSSLPDSIKRLELEVTSAEACEKAVAQVVEASGRIDILVNNAGAGATGPAAEFDVEEAKHVFDVNLFAPMRLTQLVVPIMAKQKRGLIINLGSVAGPSSFPIALSAPWTSVYSSSKAALHAWTEVLRMETKGLGIDVMLIAPGSITSGFGAKQLSSFVPIESVTTPASVLAKGIVSRALRPNPAVYYSVGGLSWTFWLLERLPKFLVWRLLARRLGTNQVGKGSVKK